jgi:hypothetical protein
MRDHPVDWLVAVALACVCGVGAAHELPANRLTLVQRDPGHVSLAFFIDYAQVLHRVLAPRLDFREFALMHAAMEPGAWAQALQRAQSRLESGTRITTANGQRLPITRWHWPDANRSQALLREHAMRMVVAPGDHEHEAPTEILAELVARSPIGQLTLKLPDELQAVLVVSYRPVQAWAKPGAPALTVTF